MASLTPAPKAQFFDANGNPLVGGKLYSYSAGTTTPLATYVDQTQTATNTNPVILDSRGEANVWLAVASYKLRLTDANNVEIWTVDNIVTDDVAVLSDLALPGGATLVGYSPGPDSLLGVVPMTVKAALDELSDKNSGSSVVGFRAAGINGTAQAGAASTITLAASSSATDDAYNGWTVELTSGTGSGQVRTISDYVGSTKVATVSTAWTTTPDATSVYNIAYPRTAQSKMRDVVSVFDFMTAAQIADVQAGTASIDVTTAIQAAIDYATSNKRSLYAPAGTYLGNWTLASELHLFGDGMNSTVFLANTNAPVFKTPTTSSTVRVLLENFKVLGNGGASNTGIDLHTTSGGTFVDNITIRNVWIVGCGSTGLIAYGTSTNGPFVQKLNCTNLTCTGNSGSGVWLGGIVLESSFRDCAIASNGDAAGVNANAYFGTYSGAAIARLKLDTCLFNHVNALSAGNPGIALHLDGAQQVTVNNCDIENADPFIKITNAFSNNIIIIGNRFGTIYAATAGIRVDDCDGLTIQNNKIGTTSTMTYAINLNSGPSRIKNSDIKNNSVGGLAVNINCLSGVATSLNRYRDYMYMSPASPVNLDYIYDSNGSTGQFFTPGDRLVLEMTNANTVTVRHAAGNIRLNGAANFPMTTNNTLTLIWSAASGCWQEIGRKA